MSGINSVTSEIREGYYIAEPKPTLGSHLKNLIGKIQKFFSQCLSCFSSAQSEELPYKIVLTSDPAPLQPHSNEELQKHRDTIKEYAVRLLPKGTKEELISKFVHKVLESARFSANVKRCATGKIETQYASYIGIAGFVNNKLCYYITNDFLDRIGSRAMAEDHMDFSSS